MIPNFKKSGLLPDGAHLTDWRSFKERFVTNAYREALLAGTEGGLKILYSYGCREI